MDSTAPKILRVGILAEVHHIDPLTAQDADSAFVIRQVAESPYGARPGTTELVPALFAAPLERDDGPPQVYRGRLRPDVRFSDGSPLTVDDVVASLRRVTLVHEQADVEADGDHVVFRMKLPNAGFEHVLFHSMSSVYKTVGGKLVATGPFMVADDSRPERVRLLRNPHYRDDVPLDELHFVAYDTDDQGRPTPLLQALEAGDVDFSNTLSKDDIGPLSGVRKSFLPGISTSMLYLNTESPRLTDPRVRQAVARSIDRVEMARTSYANALAFAASSILPRTMSPADDDLVFDLEAARALLAEAGGARPDVLRLLMIWAPRPYLPHPQRFLEKITEQLAAVDIRVEPIFTETSAEFLDRIIEGHQDMTLGGWIADTMDPSDFLESNLASSRVPDRGNIAVANNNGRLRSEAMDRALDAFRADHSGAHMERVIEVLSAEAPLVPLCYGPTTAVWNFRVRNFEPSPLSIFPFTGIDVA